MREDGFRFDRMVLTTDSSYVPTSTGPAESTFGGGGPTPPGSFAEDFSAPLAGEWLNVEETSKTADWDFDLVAGAYVQRNSVGTASIGDSFDESFHNGTHSVYLPSFSESNYQFDATIQSNVVANHDKGRDVGVVYRTAMSIP
eukprot:UN06718